MTDAKERNQALWRDGKNWRLFAIYYCPDDSRIVVPKRSRMGWTFNFAHGRAWGLLAAVMLLGAGPVLLAISLGATDPLVVGLVVVGSAVTVIFLVAMIHARQS